MSVAANFLLGSLVSRVQRVSRVWVVDNSSLAGISVNIYICCSCAICFDGGGFRLVSTCILVCPSVVLNTHHDLHSLHVLIGDVLYI